MNLQSLSRLERAVPIILLANLPSCFAGLVWLAIGLDDASGRWSWSSEVVVLLLLIGYLPIAAAVAVIAVFTPVSEQLRRTMLWIIVFLGIATAIPGAALFLMLFK